MCSIKIVDQTELKMTLATLKNMAYMDPLRTETSNMAASATTVCNLIYTRSQ